VADSGKGSQKETWENIWKDDIYSMGDLLEEDRWVSVKHSPLLPLILRRLPDGAKVLEAGCGRGQWVIYLSGLGFQVTGLDFASATIAKLRESFPFLGLVEGNITALPFEESSFDAILSWGVVEHFEDGPQRALREAHRVLKSNGALFVTVPFKSLFYRSPLLRLKENPLLRALLRRRDLGAEFFQHEFTRGQFCEYLEESGFGIRELLPISHEMGFAKGVNMQMRRGSKLFYKRRNGKWDGLTRTGELICGILKKGFPWLTPDMMFALAEKI
jgi:SAM-dependent methyltransferase